MIFIAEDVIIYSSDIYLLAIYILLKLSLCCLFNRRCFLYDSSSSVRSDIIFASYDRDKNLNTMIVEWLFLIREKKNFVYLAFLVSFASDIFFIFIKTVNPQLFSNFNDFKILLFASLTSGAFSSIVGPYMINRYYFYAYDFMSKNISAKEALQVR